MTKDTSVTTTQKQFSDSQTMDLTDEEIKNCMIIIIPLINRWRKKYAGKFIHGTATMNDFEKAANNLEDEVKTKFFDIGILATINPEVMLDGQGPQIEFLGKLPKLAALGQDHERKGWEVKKANLLGEDFLGQSEVNRL